MLHDNRVSTLCTAINERYQDKLSFDFCHFKSLFEENNADKIEALFTTAALQLHAFISLFLALQISSSNYFVAAELPEDVPVHTLLAKDYQGNPLIKLRLPIELQGIHASPHWLSRHRTNVKNQNLHRAKIIWHSWFCEKISPDQATISNKTPSAEEVAYVQDYFSPDDKHATGDSNCFYCHRKIQPLANYFGKLHAGGRLLDVNRRPIIMFFASPSEAFDRPGGYWHEDIAKGRGYYLPFGKRHALSDIEYEVAQQTDNLNRSKILDRGMPGLADLLSNLPRVHRCVVKHTWENFFGSKHALTTEDSEAALAAFAVSGFNYRSLITHLLTKPEAIQYFTEGHQVFYDMVERKQMTCETARSIAQLSAQEIITRSCVSSCHFNAEGKEHFFSPEGKIVATGDDLQTFYEIIVDDYMPDGGDYASLAGQIQAKANALQKKILTCDMEEQAQATGITLLGVDSPQDLNSMGHEGDGT